MAMLPFCGYNMGDYFGHWLQIGAKLQNPPKIFHVNWFRSDEQGKFLWPGFGENIRVIDWMMRRISGQVGANASPLGLLPCASDLDVGGLSLTPGELDQLLQVDWNAWLDENTRTLSFLDKFGSRLPAALLSEHAALENRLRDVQA
jgi:phosphoenolpyruvate carboxykinase (GTP)